MNTVPVRARGCLVLALFLLHAGIASSARGDAEREGWAKYDEYDGISMYRKEIPGNPILAYRGEGTLAAPIEKLLTVVLDTARKPEWMSRVRAAEVLREISPLEKIEYVHIKTPFILKDREFVYKIKVELNSKNRSAKVHFESVDDALKPETHERVRAHIFSCDFFMKPAPEGTWVEAEVHADPKGSIPKWIVNLYQKRLPRESLQGLLAQVSKPEIIGHPLLRKQK